LQALKCQSGWSLHAGADLWLKVVVSPHPEAETNNTTTSHRSRYLSIKTPNGCSKRSDLKMSSTQDLQLCDVTISDWRFEG
jgi:hypothetical protein